MEKDEMWITACCFVLALSVVIIGAAIYSYMSQPAHVINNERITVDKPIINNYNNTNNVYTSTTTALSSRTHSCIPPRTTMGFGMKDCPQVGDTTWYCNGKIVTEAESKCCMKAKATGVCYG